MLANETSRAKNLPYGDCTFRNRTEKMMKKYLFLRIKDGKNKDNSFGILKVK